MDSLDIIPLATAKNWISVDVSDTQWDTDIERLIRTAVDRIEKYTSWRLYQRTETIYNRQQPYYNPANYFPPVGSGEWHGSTGVRSVPGGLSIYLYPFTITSVKDSADADVTYTTAIQPLKTLLWAAPNSVITLQTGFAADDIAKIPQTFIDAALKLITDMFENRDNYTTSMPTEVQYMLNQYRRALI
jgi:hypothetical protein